MKQKTGYRALNPDKLTGSIDQIALQVGSSFPGAGLAGLAIDLSAVARDVIDLASEIRKPIWLVRVVAGVLILLALLWPLILAPFLDFKETFTSLAEFLEATDAGLHMILVMGAGVVFLVSWENRIKRNKALDSIATLRSIAHIIDMHQITKDPDFDVNSHTESEVIRTVKSDSELAVYLDFCSDMLSVIGKLGAYHIQYYRDRVVLDAVNEIESLSNGLSRKLWQKIMVINHIAEVHAREDRLRESGDENHVS